MTVALRKRLAYVLLAGVLGFSALAQASVFEPRSFRSEADERRYKALIEELRCLVCQNQNIADSDADLAKDLRERVYTMISAGRSDTEIVDFMVQRYGDFVLYRPPLRTVTAVLWVGPFVLGVVALMYLFARLRRSAASTPQGTAPLTEAQRARARALLGNEDVQPPARG